MGSGGPALGVKVLASVFLFLLFPVFGCPLCHSQAYPADRAIVKNETLPAYLEMSAASPVLKSLKRGDGVTMDLEILSHRGIISSLAGGRA